MNVFERVRETVAITLKVPPGAITETTRDEDIPAWDSLGHLNLMMALEQTFDIMLDVEDFANLKSVPAILAYLKNQGMN
jgi:acyl carrier protein